MQSLPATSRLLGFTQAERFLRTGKLNCVTALEVFYGCYRHCFRPCRFGPFAKFVGGQFIDLIVNGLFQGVC